MRVAWGVSHLLCLRLYYWYLILYVSFYLLGSKVGPPGNETNLASARGGVGTFSRSMPPRKRAAAGDGGQEGAAGQGLALGATNRLLVAMAKAQIIALGELPAGNDNVDTITRELEELVSTRAEGTGTGEEDGEEEGEEDGEEEGEEEGEEGGEDGEGGGVAAKLDEVKGLLERSHSQHEEFYNIKPTSTCGVCRKRNGGYGCFSCNVRICWDPACLRDHLALGKGNTARESQPMVRKDRNPASGSRKNHFTEEEEPPPAPASAKKKRKKGR